MVRAGREAHAYRFTAMLMNQSSVIITKDPNVRGMMKNSHLALSFADAGKRAADSSNGAGKIALKADRFEPSTQTCSSF